MTTTIVIASRGSELALWQSRWVADRLTRLHPALTTEIRTLKTLGDNVLDAPLSRIGDKGLFTKELDRALLDGSADIAVHSLKDVPTELPQGLVISALCEREDAREVFVPHPAKAYASLSAVPRGGTIATSSLRRRCLILEHRPDLSIVDVRGNLPTRIAKLASSGWDGMLLAKVGLARLGRNDLASETLEPLSYLPAVGQGALAIVSREADERVRRFVSSLDHLPTRQATTAERSLLRKLEGGCQIPVGAFGRILKGTLLLDAFIGSLDGRQCVRAHVEGAPEEAVTLGESLAEKLLSAGGSVILAQIRQTA